MNPPDDDIPVWGKKVGSRNVSDHAHAGGDGIAHSLRPSNSTSRAPAPADEAPGSEVSSCQCERDSGSQSRLFHPSQPYKKVWLHIPHPRPATRDMCESVAKNANRDE